MMKKRITVIIVVCIILSVGVAQAKLEPKEYSGFLVDYSQLKKGPEDGVAKVYKKEGVDFKQYNKIMLDHVVFYLKDDAKNKGIDPVELAELSEKFHKSVIDTLGSAYPLVDKPGPDVMRVRVAITDLELPNRTLNAITTILPVGLIVSTVKKGTTGKGTAVGEISMEFEFLDSETNQRLAAGVDRRAGGKIDSMSKLGTAEDAFKFWAQRLRTRLDEIHGK
jgi:hypothetical protein